ncbi:MAG: GGDEF domain-containing protein [Myxococcota bacterium]|nr:GGDEF domain-containing protein [Myxococcota bacterium]
MKVTDLTLREQLRLTEREIKHRQDLLDFTEADKDILVGLKPLVEAEVDTLVDDFYAAQVEIDQVARLIGDSETLARLKKHLRKYVLDLFDGEYGADYSQARLRIGLVHKRIGVTPKLYISAMRRLVTILAEHFDTNPPEDTDQCKNQINALNKIVLYDLQLVFDTYIHGLLDELARGKEEIERYAEGLEEMVAQRTQQLAELARKDGLTGLLNQRSFFEEMGRELARCQRTGESLSLIYFDLDGFKQVNDAQGHKRGDEILIATAEIIGTTIRAEDVAARYGGDEFCIILPRASEEVAQVFVRRLISEAESKLAGTGVTFSVGIATAEPDVPVQPSELVKKADFAMYVSKETPGFSVTVATDDMPIPGNEADQQATENANEGVAKSNI